MSVTEFLKHLPADRRKALEQVRSTVRKSLPKGYEESLVKGSIVWQVPLERYPDTYNGHPLWLAALAPQAKYLALYLMPAYGNAAVAQQLRDGFRRAGKTLDMGKSCIRFRKAEDLALDTIGEIIAAMPVDKWVEIAESTRRHR